MKTKFFSYHDLAAFQLKAQMKCVKTILTCKTSEHLIVAEKLVDALEKMYKKYPGVSLSYGDGFIAGVLLVKKMEIKQREEQESDGT